MGLSKISITNKELGTLASKWRIIDVRKQAAFRESGRLIPAAEWRPPFEADSWAGSVAGPVVVYCVHGHEISQGVAAYLRARGIDARYLQGGFAGYVEAGGETAPI